MATSIAPFVLFPILALSLYRRFRRNFGRQPVQPRRMALRVGLLGLVTIGFTALAFMKPGLGGAAVAGVALGLGLGLFGLKLTGFEAGPEGRWYTPNPYLGLALSTVLLARIVYRYFVLQPGGMPAPGAAPAFGSPLTVAMFGTVVGYYLCYTIGVLVRTRVPATSVSAPDGGATD